MWAVTTSTAEDAPRTRDSLADDLIGMGIRSGDTLLLHASLSALGWVCGGATAVVHAFLDVLGPDGTLVTPAQTPFNRDPSRWPAPGIPEHWWSTVREDLPCFEHGLAPGANVGAIAERVRTW